MENKRKLPNKEKIENRIKLMKDLANLSEIKPENMNAPYGMENGNGKTGNVGTKFSKIFIWNLPPVITCPGISEWCKKNCYNADDRYDKFPINRWCENLWWVLNDKELLKRKIFLQLDEYKQEKVAVRIHSSGDFFSDEYINFWKDIIERRPEVYFWAYTRSWVIEGLAEKIKELNKLDNVNIILSWDESMNDPPTGFARSIVVDSNDDISRILDKGKGIICPEQYNLVSGCADCGICIKKILEDIYFLLH